MLFAYPSLKRINVDVLISHDIAIEFRLKNFSPFFFLDDARKFDRPES